jgi:WXG100 family type VII secretion target
MPSRELADRSEIGAENPSAALVASGPDRQKGSPLPESIRVDPDQLTVAAKVVREHADQLKAGHGSAIAAAEDAQAGLVGRSAQSISAKAQRWQATTAELQGLLTSQGDALAAAAAAYAQTESDNRDQVAALGPSDL